MISFGVSKHEAWQMRETSTRQSALALVTSSSVIVPRDFLLLRLGRNVFLVFTVLFLLLFLRRPVAKSRPPLVRLLKSIMDRLGGSFFWTGVSTFTGHVLLCVSDSVVRFLLVTRFLFTGCCWWGFV